jgi:hypothetical protein
VQQGKSTVAQGANTKIKRLPSMFKNKVFSLVFKNKKKFNWRILIKKSTENGYIIIGKAES